MKVVVDTSILFSALQSPGGKAFNGLMGNFDNHEFYCPNFLIVEIFNHKEDLLKKSKADEKKVLNYLMGALQKMHFFNESLISVENFFEAWYLCKDVDENDTAFIALTLELDAMFWTKDDKLKNGLLKKGFDRFFEI